MLVLFLLFMLAICSPETYNDTNMLHEGALNNLRSIYDRLDTNPDLYLDYTKAYNLFITKTTDPTIKYTLVYLKTPDPFLINKMANPCDMLE